MVVVVVVVFVVFSKRRRRSCSRRRCSRTTIGSIKIFSRHILTIVHDALIRVTQDVLPCLKQRRRVPRRIVGRLLIDADKNSGAGDTFIGALIYALLKGALPAAAMCCACAVAARKVSQVCCTPATILYSLTGPTHLGSYTPAPSHLHHVQVGFDGLAAAVPAGVCSSREEDGGRI